MSKKVVLLVKYGSDIGAEVVIFKEQLKKLGWKEGLIEGAFEKGADGPNIEAAIKQDVNSAATVADLTKTCCRAIFVTDDIDFCWDWDR